MSADPKTACPFCDSAYTETKRDVGPGGDVRYFLYCIYCGARGPIRKTAQDALEAWDERPAQRFDRDNPPPSGTTMVCHQQHESLVGLWNCPVCTDPLLDKARKQECAYTGAGCPFQPHRAIPGKLYGWLAGGSDRGVEFIPDENVDFNASGEAILLLPEDPEP